MAHAGPLPLDHRKIVVERSALGTRLFADWYRFGARGEAAPLVYYIGGAITDAEYEGRMAAEPTPILIQFRRALAGASIGRVDLLISLISAGAAAASRAGRAGLRGPPCSRTFCRARLTNRRARSPSSGTCTEPILAMATARRPGNHGFSDYAANASFLDAFRFVLERLT
jgi:hypothetical protein